MTQSRHFLLLQGPHGPFFRELGTMLGRAGDTVTRVAFNAGDAMFADPATLVRFTGSEDRWPEWLRARIASSGVTDLVLYGQPRPRHGVALEIARAQGLRKHIFEEGYLRPYWITYEREGTNGDSRLMQLDLGRMREMLGEDPTEMPEAPATWGEMRHHVLFGALYHGAVMAGSRAFPEYRSHRDQPISQELRLSLGQLARMPILHLRRSMSLRRIRAGAYPYHLVLLQLAHDASFRAYSDFDRYEDFLDLVIDGFSRGAPGHHQLVFKAHPLDDGRAPLASDIRRLSAKAGVADRVHFQTGGKLAPLLDHAASAVTVNSTAAQQALWRGLPVRIFGTAVYGKPGLVSSQPIDRFFAAPDPPDLAAYREFRQFLLRTSQFRGGFYSRSGRRTLLRGIVDAIRHDLAPYDRLAQPDAAESQHIRVIG